MGSASRPLRFVALGDSIASDWNNPVATSARAVLAAIAHAGHEVTFLEQRGNSALTGMLRTRGSRAFKAFTDRFRQIQYRTYDIPRGWQRVVWFGQEISTADAVIALPGTPEALLPELSDVASARLIRLIDKSYGITHTGFSLVRASELRNTNDLVFGPAVAVTPAVSNPRSQRLLLVAYDDAVEAKAVAAMLASHDPELVVSGTADLPGWTYVPEVELPDLYKTRRIAIVIDAPSRSEWQAARRLLPLGSGCASPLLSAGTAAAVLSGALDHRLPVEFNAKHQADAIIAAVRARLAQ